MEAALTMRDTFGTDHAADWLEARNVNRPLAILALIGSVKAERYGIFVGRNLST